jgi:hypothetical protein
MQQEMVFKKRPCRICRRWFTPNPRLKDRQMTCGDERCKNEWHRKKCAEWNEKNADYFRSNYLQKKLDAVSQYDKVRQCGNPPPGPKKSRLKSGLPHRFVQEVIGIQHLIIIEYFGRLLIKRFQEVLKGQLFVNTEQIERLSINRSSRCDRL